MASAAEGHEPSPKTKYMRVLAFLSHATPVELGQFAHRAKKVEGALFDDVMANTDSPVFQPGLGRTEPRLFIQANPGGFISLMEVIEDYHAKHGNGRAKDARADEMIDIARGILVRNFKLYGTPRNSKKPFVARMFSLLPKDAQERKHQPFTLRLRRSGKPYQGLSSSKERYSPRYTRKKRSGSGSGSGSRSPVVSPKESGPSKQEGGGRRSRKQKPLTRKNRPVAGFAVVHSTEKPWVNEPNYRRWIRKLHRHTAKVKKHGDAPNPVNMCLDTKICKGDLGIPRKLMPQFTSPKDIKSFVEFAEKRYGIKSVRGTRRAGQLRPSQEEINRERVEDVADDIRFKKLDPKVPLIVSADNYVIDGHHRWAAFKKDKPNFKMPVLIVKDSARDVLSMAATWGAKHHQF